MTPTPRTVPQDQAYRIGRAARIRGLDLESANVDLARRLGWRVRADFDDALLDECENGWYAQDKLMQQNKETTLPTIAPSKPCTAARSERA